MNETTQPAEFDAPAVKASAKALDEILHAERHKANSRNVDCWVCEAMRSPAIRALISAHVQDRAAASHANAVLARAVPDEEERAALWRDHWRDVLATIRTGVTPPTQPATSEDTTQGSAQ